jgi:hypothetical protein
LDQWSGFEESMPLVARGSGFVASHAAPGTPLTTEEIDSRSDKAFKTLAWTDNTRWGDDSEKKRVLQDNLNSVGADPGAKWLCGHRKVDHGTYRGQFDDQLVQINPDGGDFVVAMIPADGSFEPKRDTFRL